MSGGGKYGGREGELFGGFVSKLKELEKILGDLKREVLAKKEWEIGKEIDKCLIISFIHLISSILSFVSLLLGFYQIKIPYERRKNTQ